jgi:hypothetical protein
MTKEIALAVGSRRCHEPQLILGIFRFGRSMPCTNLCLYHSPSVIAVNGEVPGVGACSHHFRKLSFVLFSLVREGDRDRKIAAKAGEIKYRTKIKNVLTLRDSASLFVRNTVVRIYFSPNPNLMHLLMYLCNVQLCAMEQPAKEYERAIRFFAVVQKSIYHQCPD